MNILGIETSAAEGSIALYCDGNIIQRSLGESRQQAGQILPIIDELLTEQDVKLADLDLLTFSAGPGSFTGVRIALGIIQGLALPFNTPVVPISSLQVLAQTTHRLHGYQRVICAIDAFMGEIYWGQYQVNAEGWMLAQISDQVSKPADLILPEAGLWEKIGNAWEVYHLGTVHQVVTPQAFDLVQLAAENQQKKLIIDAVLPYYLRNKDAWGKNMTTREKLLEKIRNVIQKEIPAEQYDLVITFFNQYVHLLSEEDLQEYDATNFAGLVLSQWHLAQGRKVNEARVRIYNPALEQNGWESTRTIIEVSHDDMPFLVDSVRMEINRHNLAVHFIIHVGGMKLRRSNDGMITEILPWGSTETACQTEAPLHFEVDKTTDAAFISNLTITLEKILADVRATVHDWQLMRQRMDQTIQQFTEQPPAASNEEVTESIDFLKWLNANHFTYMGVRDYELVTHEGKQALKLVANSGCGVLKDTTHSLQYRYLSDMPSAAVNAMLAPHGIIIAKSNTLSTVHRPVYTDYIGVKRFDKSGRLIGERRFIGLFTSSAYHSRAEEVPLLRLKFNKILAESKLLPASHAYKALVKILEAMPRDDLFQGDLQEIKQIAFGILNIEERDKIRLFTRKDIYNRYISCLLFIPKYRYTNSLRRSVQKILEHQVGGKMTDYQTVFGDSTLAQINFVIRLETTNPIHYDIHKIEQEIINQATMWQDQLQQQIFAQWGDEQGRKLYAQYSQAFSNSYREKNTAQSAAVDLQYILQLTNQQPIAFNLIIQPVEQKFGFKIYRLDHPAPLSDVMPILENLGMRALSENSYRVQPEGHTTIWVNDFEMEASSYVKTDFSTVKKNFEQVFAGVWHRQFENDGFNKLILLAGFDAQQVVLVRALAKYMRQMGIAYNQSYIEETVGHYPNLIKSLFDLFALRFNPETMAITTAVENQINQINQGLDQVSSLEEDTILRLFLTLIKAMLRTNFYQIKNGAQKPYLSFKFDPHAIPELPKPRPMFEIFVYSSAFEAIHLRGGKVARGGLRWSDRREDFRTEVLGLMKAQQVKNSVIVPTGAKGGFVVKTIDKGMSRDQQLAEGIACYRNFIRGLLDITDNYVQGKVVYPENTIRYDEDDPYLVVAADKGTASFSDIANEISHEYHFWLGDAFASGGKAGYDHKKMGITARGAWISVRRHFRGLGINPDTMPITVAGIGDMSGDLFGNGMLLSHQIKLVAAFNHQHIFLDPSPDLAASYKERERMFNLPRSSWTDYDKKVISAGGGVFARSEKFITLTPQVKALLQLQQDTIVPNDLINAILKAPVDLIWNGGIGTYVKAKFQNNLEVGDRANDPLRVNGGELRCKVFAEGGNLGCTQAGRIEYALKGGLIYTDFIDNSGGVDCSDKEVNTKILLSSIVKAGLLNEADRNELLKAMTGDVAQLVLSDNYKQTLAIELAVGQVNHQVDIYSRFMNVLEERAILERDLEALPSPEVLSQRKAEGFSFTRPEIAVLFSYSKLYLKARLLDSTIPEDLALAHYVYSAFPQELTKRYAEQLQQHQLKREIIATQLSNDLINEMGAVFIYGMYHETGASFKEIVPAYVIARELFELKSLWQQIQALDTKLSVTVQNKMLLLVSKLVWRGSRWFVRRYRESVNITTVLAQYQPALQQMLTIVPQALSGLRKEHYEQLITEFTGAGVPKVLAERVALCDALFSVLDIIDEVQQTKVSLTDFTKVYYQLGDQLLLTWLRYEIRHQQNETHLEWLALAGILDDIDDIQRVLTASVFQCQTKANLEQQVHEWLAKNERLVNRWIKMVNSIRGINAFSTPMLFVGLRELQELAQACLR